MLTVNQLILKAHEALTYGKGRPEHVPSIPDIQEWIDGYLKKQGHPTSEAANTETIGVTPNKERQR